MPESEPADPAFHHPIWNRIYNQMEEEASRLVAMIDEARAVESDLRKQIETQLVTIDRLVVNAAADAEQLRSYRALARYDIAVWDLAGWRPDPNPFPRFHLFRRSTR